MALNFEQSLAHVKQTRLEGNRYVPHSIQELRLLLNDASIPLRQISLHRVKSLRGAFADLSTFKRNQLLVVFPEAEVDTNLFMVAQVTRDLNELCNWDVSCVTNLSFCFAGRRDFNHDLNGWNTQQVQNADFCFLGCSGFNQPLNWRLPQVQSLQGFMAYCGAYNQPLTFELANLKINADQIPALRGMFEDAWLMLFNLHQVEFRGARVKITPLHLTTKKFSAEHERLLLEHLRNRNNQLEPRSVVQLRFLLARYPQEAKNLGWSKLTNLDGAFAEYKEFARLYSYLPQSLHEIIAELQEIGTTQSSQAWIPWEERPALIHEVIKSLDQATQVTSARALFAGRADLNLALPENFLPNLQHADGMFMGCSQWSMKVVLQSPYLRTARVLMAGCQNFKFCFEIKSTQLEEVQGMFAACVNLNQKMQLNLEKVERLDDMFYRCVNLNREVQLRTQRVRSMDRMFSHCYSFNQPLSFNTPHLESMHDMLQDCYKLEQPLTWNARNTRHIDIEEVALGARKLRREHVNWNKPELTNGLKASVVGNPRVSTTSPQATSSLQTTASSQTTSSQQTAQTSPPPRDSRYNSPDVNSSNQTRGNTASAIPNTPNTHTTETGNPRANWSAKGATTSLAKDPPTVEVCLTPADIGLRSDADVEYWSNLKPTYSRFNAGLDVKSMVDKQFGFVHGEDLEQTVWGTVSFTTQPMAQPVYSSQVNLAAQRVYNQRRLPNGCVQPHNVSELRLLLTQPQMSCGRLDLSKLRSLRGAFAALRQTQVDYVNPSNHGRYNVAADRHIFAQLAQQAQRDGLPAVYDLKVDWNGIEMLDVAHIQDFSYCFAGQVDFNRSLLNWNVSNGLSFAGMFYYCSSYNQALHSWDVKRGMNFQRMFAHCVSFNQPLYFVFDQARDMSFMLAGCLSWNQGWQFRADYVRTCEGLFLGCRNLNNTIGIKAASLVNTAHMFRECRNMRAAVFLQLPSLQNATYMFANAVNFNKAVSLRQAENLRDISFMFFRCASMSQELTLHETVDPIRNEVQFGAYAMPNISVSLVGKVTGWMNKIFNS